MVGVKRAHHFDIDLCSDKSCGDLHLVFFDENEQPFAEAIFKPPFDTGAIFNELIALCFKARERLYNKGAPEPPVPH